MKKTVLLLKQPLVILLAIFYSLCFTTLFAWYSNDRFPATGDEPHYLVMADGIARYRTLEQTQPYADEFRTRRIYPFGLADASQVPDATNTHAVQGPRGLFNVHNIGLALVLALPFALAGVGGAKVFMVLLNGVAVYCAWYFAKRFSSSTRVAMASVLTLTCGLPFIPAANQIYPDLLAGVVALWAVTQLFSHEQGLGSSQPSPWNHLVLGGIAAAFLPWLHLKFAIAATILTCGLCYAKLKQSKSLFSSFIVATPLLLSAGGLVIYNLYAFGAPTGPYTESALQLSPQSLTVLLGLYIDQFQGILLQNPSLLLGLLFAPLFMRRYTFVGLLLLGVHFAFVLPNSMHYNWYGGSSFAGRFAWSGALLLVPLAIFGLSEIAKDIGKKSYGLFLVLILLQVSSYWRYSFSNFPLYNVRKLLSSEYPTFIPWLRGYTPILYDSIWSYTYRPNIVWLLGLLLLLALGWLYAQTQKRQLFYRVLPGFLACFVTVLAVSRPVYPYSWSAYDGGSLPSQIGEVEDAMLVARQGRDQPGFLSDGPYIIFDPHRYRSKLTYKTSALSEPLGRWELVAWPDGSIVDSGPLTPTTDLTELPFEFEVTPALKNSVFGVRTVWQGQGELFIRALTFEPIDEAS